MSTPAAGRAQGSEQGRLASPRLLLESELSLNLSSLASAVMLFSVSSPKWSWLAVQPQLTLTSHEAVRWFSPPYTYLSGPFTLRVFVCVVSLPESLALSLYSFFFFFLLLNFQDSACVSSMKPSRCSFPAIAKLFCRVHVSSHPPGVLNSSFLVPMNS